MAREHKTKVGRYTVTDGGIPSQKTLTDGTPYLMADQASELEIRAAITVLREVELVSGAELKFARKALGLRQTELAEQLGVTSETVSRWENDAESFKRTVQLAICDLLATVQQTGKLPEKRTSKGFNLRVA